MLNLERVVFDLMRGRPEDATVNDAAYGVLFLLSLLSILLFIPLAIGYGVLVRRARKSGVSAIRSGIEV
jgi:hypothetical protein